MNIVVMAAGQGKRMRSDLPKVLHPIAGQTLLSRVIGTARQLSPSRIVIIYGHGGDQVIAAQSSAYDTTADAALRWAKQEPQLGTGHAVMQALPQLDDAVPTLVLNGDVPLTRVATLQKLLQAAGKDKLGLLTVNLPDPAGYGRIVREKGRIQAIVEHKDSSPEQLAIKEIYSGILVCPTPQLKKWLAGLSNNNAQKEYYLTDIVKSAVADGVEIVAAQPQDSWETDGVNSKVQLAQLERAFQMSQAIDLMEAGVMLADPARLDVRGSLNCGRDVTIDVNCVFEGQVTLGDRVKIGPNCVIKDAVIAPDTVVQAFCHIDGATIGAQSKIGPFARLRPGTELGEDNHIGNFVELKNTRMARASKANHLAYVGDSIVGSNVNIGAGVITCNYDGANKSTTVIEDDAFIGSDCQLVAPVKVGRGATLAAGTTLTRDAPPAQLTISRVKQSSLASWQRPVKASKGN